MTIDKYEPIYASRPENFGVVKNPANTSDWSVVQESKEDNFVHFTGHGYFEDRFYGNGFVTGPDVPSPECANEEFWTLTPKYKCHPLKNAYELEFTNRPIC